MSVNGISTTYANYTASAYAQSNTTKATETSDTTSTTSSTKTENSAVYESSSKKLSKEDNAALIQKLKADTDARVSQLRSLVEKMFTKQGQKVKDNDSMWSMLASGNFTVDAETAAAAKAEISEDGYWGVNQTSDRIFEMAKALSGGDDAKMDKMLSAFKKGFQEATKSWGRSLPDISQKTYDAVLEKFKNYKSDVEA